MKAQLGIICIILVIPAGCKPKRDARCPSQADQIDVSLEIALVDDTASEDFIRAQHKESLEAAGISILKEPVSEGLQGKLVSHYLVRGDAPTGERKSGRDIIDYQVDKELLPSSRRLGYSRKPSTEGAGFLWRTYILLDPSSILDQHVRSARIIEDEQPGRTIVWLTLTGEGKQKLAAITTENIDRRIAIILNGEVQTTLLIGERNESGEMKIPLQRLGHDDETRWQHACGLLR